MRIQHNIAALNSYRNLHKILYIFSDYPYKYYTFKHFEV